MSKGAISFQLKAASRYHADRPCEGILANGADAGITAGLKNTSCSSTLISLLAPDGGTVIADWKTAPCPANRHTGYSGCSSAIGSITGYCTLETPKMLMLILEANGPVEDLGCHSFGEVVVALDSSLGESASYGHADGRSIYGMLVGRHEMANAAGKLPHDNAAQQSHVFVGAETTKRRIFVGAPSKFGLTDSNGLSATILTPTGYAPGELSFRHNLMMAFRDSHAFWSGYPAWLTQVKQAAHWTPLTLGGVATMRFGFSTSVSSFALSPSRKDGEALDTIYTSRVVGTWAAWTDFLQAVFDDWSTDGHLHYWEILGSA